MASSSRGFFKDRAAMMASSMTGYTTSRLANSILVDLIPKSVYRGVRTIRSKDPKPNPTPIFEGLSRQMQELKTG